MLLTFVAFLLAPSPDAEILNVVVSYESSDEVELAVTYRLDATGDDTFLRAITTFGGSSTGYWSYRPAKLEPGRHVARVRVGRSSDAPSVYRSDGFKISTYGGVSLDHVFVYEKSWCGETGGCDDSALVEAARAPLAKRLTSIQPSIRTAALAEAEDLDDDERRELLHEIVDAVHHGDRRVRFNALRLLQAWQLRDPLLTASLVDAMGDPHPGISRVATAVLARLAEPTDAFAEDALHRAAASSDESTRLAAERGLERLARERRLASKPKLDVPMPESEADCLEAGGRWGLFGLYRLEECNLPTPDVGSRCNDSIECISACIAEEPTDDSGTCYGWTIVRGTCLVYVENGEAKGPICVD